MSYGIVLLFFVLRGVFLVAPPKADPGNPPGLNLNPPSATSLFTTVLISWGGGKGPLGAVDPPPGLVFFRMPLLLLPPLLFELGGAPLH